MIVEVALNVPIRKCFDYYWPNNIDRHPEEGLQVLVPFGRQKKGGIIVNVNKKSKLSKLKYVESLAEENPIFSEEILKLTRWTSEYYFCAWGEVLNAAIPGGLSLRINNSFFPQTSQLPDIESLSKKVSQLARNQQYWSEQEWLKCQPNEKDHKIMNQWLDNKYVIKKQVMVDKKIKAKMEYWVRLVNSEKSNIKTSNLNSKQKQLLDILKNHSEISRKEILHRLKSSSRALSKLNEDGLIEMFEKRVYRRFLDGSPPEIEPFLNLNPQQNAVFNEVSKSIKKGSYRTFLLEGVTGSGKTEIYLQAAKASLKKGKSCLILVPEISLTPQLVNRFRSRFGDQVAVLHSGMDDGERFDEWSRINKGLASIVIGARSAVFAPVNNLGLIVVDEEHDSSYKQSESPRYNGRDVAIYRGFISGATVLLGSATPSLESANNVNIGKFKLLNLPSRINQGLLPKVRLLDMKTVPGQKGSPYFSSELVEALRLRLLKKEQSILFLNRRGFAPLIRCPKCDSNITCPNCSLSLVYHQKENQMRCHQCDLTKPLHTICPECESEQEPLIIGTGTEQVEENLKIFFPDARILRMDRDTLHGKHSLSRMHNQISKHEVDIVIGTQLVTKGHDFPEVTLVGVIFSDLSLNIPDFRSSERTFQLLTQVAGRAGRGNKPGEVLIQTHNPRHHSLICAKDHDSIKFREIELEQRHSLRMPPNYSLTMILCSSPSEDRAELLARELYDKIRAVLSNKKLTDHNYLSNCEQSNHTPKIIGPFEAPIKKLRNKFRWQLMLKATNVRPLLNLLHLVFENRPTTKRYELIQIDVDPHNLM